MSEGKTKKIESIVRGSTQLCAAVRVFMIHCKTQFRTKNSLNLRLKQYIVDTVTMKYSK